MNTKLLCHNAVILIAVTLLLSAVPGYGEADNGDVPYDLDTLQPGERALVTLPFEFDIASRDFARTVLSSQRGVVVDSAAGLMRSTDGGFRAYMRFAPGSLPRPVRRWFGGGNKWGVVPPDSVEVREERR